MLFLPLAVFGLLYHHWRLLGKHNFSGNTNGTQIMSIHNIHLKRVRMTVQLSIIPLGLITFYADQERMVKCGFSVLNCVFGLLLNNNNFKK